MTHPSYPAILEKFSQIQEDPYEVAKHDLLSLGVTVEMIPDLIETILDESYYGDDESVAGYPQLFAYIALGQLKTPAAIDGLILGVKKWSQTDWFEWFCEAMPDIFGAIGAIAIPALIPVLQDKSLDYDARTSAAHYLHSISVINPDQRDRCLAAIVSEFAQFAENDPQLNGYLVMTLVADFNAIETASTIEAAYAAERVAMEFIGDWEDIQVEFGMIPERVSPRRNYFLGGDYAAEDLALNRAFARQSDQIDSIIESQKDRFKQANAKQKVKRKQAKESRKKNRRK